MLNRLGVRLTLNTQVSLYEGERYTSPTAR